MSAAQSTLERTLAEFPPPSSPQAQTPQPLFRPISEGKPFPIDALPDVLKAGAIGAQGRTQAPIALCAQSALATASLGAAKVADVRLHTGRAVPTSLFLGTIAASGERKTSTDHELNVAVRNFEEDKKADHGARLEDWRIKHATWETITKEAHRKNKKDREALEQALRTIGPAPLEPMPPIATVGGDPTVEGLWLLLRDGYGFAGIYSSEGGLFIGSHAMTEDNKIRTAAALSSIWDGEPWKRSRRGDGNSVLSNRRVAAHLMMQPDLAAGLLGDRVLMDQGLLSRFLIAAPPSAMGTRFGSPTPDTERALSRFNDSAQALWSQPVRHLEQERGALDLRILSLEPSAAEIAEAFARWTEAHLGENGVFRPISGFAAKLTEHATRLGGVSALIADSEAQTIGAEDIERGITLARWYSGEALRLFDQGRVPADLLSAERVRLWMLNDWGTPCISLPDIYQRGPRDVRTKEKASRTVKILEECYWLTRIEEGATVAGSFRREVWAINRGSMS